MPMNIEVKARIRNRAMALRVAHDLSGAEPIELRQSDVFYRVARGRLKLRTFGEGGGELIFYERPDKPGPKSSVYRVVKTDDPLGVHYLLSESLGEVGRVEKVRRVFLVGRTRIHIDDVEGVGSFLELEVVLAEGEAEFRGEDEARELMAKLGVKPPDLIEGAYLDLLMGDSSQFKVPQQTTAPKPLTSFLRPRTFMK